MLNFRKGTIQDELDQLFETLTEAPVAASVTPAAFCKARKKLRPEAFETLNQTLLSSAYPYLPRVAWHGFRVLAVDGSTARLPAYAQIEKAFGGPSDSHVPMARFSRLYDVLTGLVIRADMVAYHRGERELASQYISELQPNDLVLYDRGYPAFWLLAYHVEEQRRYCARLPRDFHPEVAAFLESGERSRVVNLVPGRAATRLCDQYNISSAPIPVRLVRVELNTGDVEVLATSLLDEQAYPTVWFAKLYQLRWGVEELYKRDKLRLEIENFSGRTPLSLRQDFHAKILAENLTAIFVLLAQQLVDQRYAHRKRCYQVNFANALSKMKNNIIRVLLNTSPMPLCCQLIEKISQSTEAVRPNRTFPRELRKLRVRGFFDNYKRTR